MINLKKFQLEFNMNLCELESFQENDSMARITTPKADSRRGSTASAKAHHLLELAAKKKALVSRAIWIFVVFACVTGCLGQVFTFLEIFWRLFPISSLTHEYIQSIYRRLQRRNNSIYDKRVPFIISAIQKHLEILYFTQSIKRN